MFGLFVVQVLDSADRSVVVDLTSCETLDRKFLDTLIDLHRHYGRGPSPRFAIAARADLDLWRSVPARLGPIVNDLIGPPDILGEERELPPMEAGTHDPDLHLRDWHCRLASLVEPRQPAYEPITGVRTPELACR
jgi:hypothetical protein